MSILYVVSDRGGAGKTALCASLVHLLRAQGKTAAALKPIAGDNGDADTAIYAALLGADTSGWGVPSADDAGAVAAIAKRLDAHNDFVVVEAQGAVSAEHTPRIADALGAQILLVIGYTPSLTAGEAHAAIRNCGERLVGCILNGVTQHMGTDARERLVPSISALSANAPMLGLIPEDRRLLGVSVDQLAAHLEGELILDEYEECDTSGIVEYLMVGGMSLDSGEYYYAIHDNRAAIVRGDRPDLQMSALSAPGRTACIVATNGIEPIEYVRYEAELEETPIIIVESDTLTTMDNLDSLISISRFDHPLKLERYVALLSEHFDLDRLMRACEA